ncbi:peptide ligase PGM1-related protein [Candidatus Leptofilum sp.]|uniref:peptide ligase PGM1-related protein n=1 Tax=Candidatus Leptofilum sp. TaxID=3241576 RepID=UPI003B5AF404
MLKDSHNFPTNGLNVLSDSLRDITIEQKFATIQKRMAPMFETVFPDPLAPRTVIVIPSLTMDAEELNKISGIYHYEERMLCLLMLLQLPRTNLIFVTSQPVHEAIIDYYLHLLPGIPGYHARRRLTLLSCHDGSSISLTEKILQRPRLLDRIRAAIPNPEVAHITCFNTTPLERRLAVELNAPLYACDPALTHWGSKSNGRKVFQAAGVPLPMGFEDLRDEQDIINALTQLKEAQPSLRKAVVKLNDGFSGEGNAVFSYEGCGVNGNLRSWIATELPKRLRFEAATETWASFSQKFRQMQGIVESWIDGEDKRSPSVQCRINPLGQTEIVSTHDQVLGGPSGQIFLGCTFPADAEYRLEIQEAGRRIGEVLQQQGVIGRFAVDFISVREGDSWQHYAIEINLRKGGTTHPFLMLQFLTNGIYDVGEGQYFTPMAQPRYYYASDNVHSNAYLGLTPDDLVDLAVLNGLHFSGATQQGVVFHLMGALSEFGKFGTVCIGDSPERAKKLYKKTINTLEQAANL